MQVKKFEAKTMKEALQLIKQELGPEAIILNAKDNKKSFGLVGRGSIEVTAAISEKSLQKKQFTESRMTDASRDRFKTTTAKQQKSVIDNTVNKFHERQDRASEAAKRIEERPTPFQMGAGRVSPQTLPNRRYIDILDDDHGSESEVKGRRVDDVLKEFIKSGNFNVEGDAPKPAPVVQYAINSELSFQERDDVQTMKKEIESLRNLLSQYQNNAGKTPLTQHPGAEFGLPFELASSFEKLASAGIDTRYIVEILEQANRELTGLEKKKRSLIDAWVARYILSHTSIVGNWIESRPQTQVHLFVGAAGHGKTSALVKTVSQMVLHEKKKIAIFSTDIFKVGAVDQLKIYAQILNVPFETFKHSTEFTKLMGKYSEFDAVFVDYPGFSLKNMGEIDQLRSLLPSRETPKTTHLVLSCAVKDIDAYEICQRYQATQFNDIIFTKVDESSNHGLLYNVQRKTEKPLYAFGIGPKLPEDYELATRERVLDLIYKLTRA